MALTPIRTYTNPGTNLNGATFYAAALSGASAWSSSSTILRPKWRTAGTLSYYGARVNSYTSGSPAVRPRINNATGNSVVKPTSVGEWWDTTHSDTIAAGDDLAHTASTGTYSVAMCGFHFAPSTASDSCTRLGGANPSGGAVTGASTTGWMPVTGHPAFSTLAESVAQQRAAVAGTWKYLSCYVDTNTRGTNCTVTNRINGAPGAMTLTLTTAAATLYEDTLHTSDTVVATDLLTYQATTLTGTGTTTITHISSEITTTDRTVPAGHCDRNATYGSSSFGTGTYDHEAPICGAMPTNVARATPNWQVRGSLQAQHQAVSNLWVNITANTRSQPVTIALAQAGVATSLTLTISASTTGTFSDTVHAPNVSTSDLLSWLLTASSATGSATLGGSTFRWEPFVESGTAALVAGGVLAASGIRTVLGTVTLSGGGVLSASGLRTVLGSAALLVSDALAASATRIVGGLASLSAGASLAATGVRKVFGSASTSVGGVLEASGLRMVFGSASLAPVFEGLVVVRVLIRNAIGRAYSAAWRARAVADLSYTADTDAYASSVERTDTIVS